MAQRDYILRMIEQAGETLRALRDRLLGRDVDRKRLRQELSSVFEHTGLDPDTALNATPDTLLLMVAPTGELDATRAWILAESLYLMGVAADLEHHPAEARAAYLRAHRLYAALAPGAAFYGLDEAEGRLHEIEHRMERLHSGGPPPEPLSP